MNSVPERWVWRCLRQKLIWVLALLVLGAHPWLTKADSTFVYAVQLSAGVQTTPPQITLNWEPDPYGATNYIVYRKNRTDLSWGTPVAILPGYFTNFADTAVTLRSSYEYQVVKYASLGYRGYGYLYSGIEAPASENRGTVILVVASESTLGLTNELARLQEDLVGDGWQVIRQEVSSNDTPQTVRALIQADYHADPTNVNTVFLLGHVPILQSGYINYDGHGARPMPTDAYYGEMNDDWPTDPTNSPSYLPSDVALMVGRVDLANMPGAQSARPWPNEVALLQNYLNKDHAWRTGQMRVQGRALMGNRRGDERGVAVAASGYRAFEPLVGPGNTIEANIADVAPANERWSSMLTNGSYLLAYGCGGGQNTAIGYLGTHNTDYEVWSTDLVDNNAQAVFVMVYGSHFGNWDVSDDIMRAVLATPQTGLACCMSGVPHWFFHHIGLGETIGYSTRLTMNNSTMYQTQSNTFTRAVYIALMGDPTLRLDPLMPATNLTAQADSAGVHLTWSGSDSNVLGYNVYRSATDSGPFSRLNDAPVPGTTFTDVTAPPGIYTYMVRAVQLQENYSGSYFNLSEGVFTRASVSAPTNHILVQVSIVSDQVVLSWLGQAGVVYHVEATSTPSLPDWTQLSGQIAATGVTNYWSEPLTNSSGSRFYRISN
jgi:hypothetical protein